MANTTMQKCKRAMARHTLYVMMGLFQVLPFKVVRFLMRILMSIGYYFVASQRKIAFESLQVAFGKEKTKKEREEISRKCFLNTGEGLIESAYCLARIDKIKETPIVFEGRHYLDEALAQNKGVIAVSAHLGNFPLMISFVAQQGYDTYSILRPTRDEKLEKFLFKKRTALGFKTVYAIPPRQSVVDSLKALRGKGLLFILLDQNFGREGAVFVDFFGKKAATATGPVKLAMKTGAPIVPMFMVRDEENKRHKIIVNPPLALAEGNNEQEVIQNTVADITALIEKYIRLYPYQWSWMHRRWKTRPPEENLNIEEQVK